MQDRSKLRAIRRYTRALAVALDERDPNTGSHCERVVDLAIELGAACSLSERDITIVGVSACFHDIGKIGIPDEVLRKPGRFTAPEWEIMKSHPLRGERILRATLLPDAGEIATVVRHHHENFDGSGYPDGLAGDKIPLLARIVSIADCYDAMATPRSYHLARGHDDVLAVMRSEVHVKYDPDLFGRFADMIRHSPSRVQ